MTTPTPEGLQEPALREAAQPFADLLAGSKATAPEYTIDLLICPEGSSNPYDWRGKINALRSALATLPQQAATGEGEAIAYLRHDKETGRDELSFTPIADMPFNRERFEQIALGPITTPQEDCLTKRVAEVVAEDGGCWSACSGCQESVDGYVSSKDYPRSRIFKCQPGSGCRECGGIGVVWQDSAFLAGYGEALSTPTSQPPAAETRLEEAGRQFARIKDVERALANGAHYADDPECHPCYPTLVAARQILEKLFAALTQPEPTAQQGGEEIMELRDRVQRARDSAGSHFTTLMNQTADQVIAALSAQQAAGEAEAVRELIEMLSPDGPKQDGATVFDHTPEEIGLHVMENHEAIRATLSAPTEPVAFASPGQLAQLADKTEEGGTYIPLRKTSVGNFTMALYATPQPTETQRIVDDLRADGWMVAVHNDYRLNGKYHTFWLFTHPNGRWIKGEGETDAQAIAEAASQASGEHLAGDKA